MVDPKSHSLFTRSLIIAGLIFGSAVIVSTAFAGECPADQALAGRLV
jgi:hypothetical protein